MVQFMEAKVTRIDKLYFDFKSNEDFPSFLSNIIQLNYDKDMMME